MGERGVRNAEVEGSNPLPSTMQKTRENRGPSWLAAGVVAPRYVMWRKGPRPAS